jgi:hypothetical protein
MAGEHDSGRLGGVKIKPEPMLCPILEQDLELAAAAVLAILTHLLDSGDAEGRQARHGSHGGNNAMAGDPAEILDSVWQGRPGPVAENDIVAQDGAPLSVRGAGAYASRHGYSNWAWEMLAFRVSC